MPDLEALLPVALDLGASLSAEDRYGRLLSAVEHVLPCDASALLRLVDDQTLLPLATRGLVPQARGKRYALADHPRLEEICAGEGPRLFPPDCPHPDPFDGLIEGDAHSLCDVHACLGLPLRAEGRLIGVLTADALDAGAFAAIDSRTLELLGALAGAALHSSILIEALEARAAREGLVAKDLMRDGPGRSGTELVGTSPEIRRVRGEIELVGRSELSVLITGETGAGKEVVARAIHRASARSDAPLIYLNCAALPESVAESELFGHRRGAFTGADQERAGKFEIADGGTLFLDEIGELPLSIQPKLLRALQEGEIQRLGSDRPHSVDVRVIAATNRVLADEVANGHFRADLYHRLKVFELQVPPLRERVADVGALAGHFCDRIRRQLGVGPVRIDAHALDRLLTHSWPGNVRELENLLSRVTLRASLRYERGEAIIIGASDLANDFGPDAAASTSTDGAIPNAAEEPLVVLPLKEATESFQRRLIEAALERNGGNRAAAARELGLDRSNLHRLARRLGITP